MRSLINVFASPRWLAYLLPWFMLLLVLGTVAQRYIGLADAQHLFFSSWVLWIGIFPAPGGITTLAAITLNMLMKLLFKSPWRKENAGTLITHLSIVMLLLGGGITWLVNQEGYISLAEGESTAQMQDYYARELVIFEHGKVIAHWEEAVLSKGTTLRHTALPFALKVEDFCGNCATFLQEKPEGKDGLAQKILLQPAPPAKEKEDNKAGLTFRVKGLGYIAYELLPSQAPIVHFKNKEYRIVLQRKSISLPFAVKLLDFEKIRYPGSDQAKEYESLVEITDGTKQWKQTISMNEPLRHRGYALYQSSFTRTNSAEISVLSVVKNDAWLLPYFSTFLLAVGLIVQLWIRRRGTE